MESGRKNDIFGAEPGENGESLDQKAERAKQAGNESFRTHDYKRARASYTDAIDALLRCDA